MNFAPADETQVPLVPRVSCILPTANRRAVISLFLEGLLGQTYPALELVVVDGGEEPIEDIVASFPNLRYAQVPPSLSLGARRNLACELSTGEIVIQCDDDDWYAPTRIALQVEPIIAGRADVTGLICRHLLDLHKDRWWTLSEWLHRSLFVGNVHCGTIAFRRSLFVNGARYPEIDSGEDAGMLRELLRRQARLARIEGADVFAYVRHGANTWKFVAGRQLSPNAWRPGRSPRGMSKETVERLRKALPPSAGAPTRRTGWPPRPLTSQGDTIVDCLGTTEIKGLSAPLAAERCIVVIAEERSEESLRKLLRSIRRWGECADALLVVLAFGGSAFTQRVRREHGATVLPCRALAPRARACKSAFFSVARVVACQQYLNLDVETIVLGSLAPIFDRIGTSAEDALLAVPVASGGRGALVDNLVEQCSITPVDAELLSGGTQSSREFPFIHDGVIGVGSKMLLSIDRLIRERPDWGVWCRGDGESRNRVRAVLNMAIASRGELIEMAPEFNVQLDCQSVKEEPARGRIIAVWNGRPAHVLHFGGQSARPSRQHLSRCLVELQRHRASRLAQSSLAERAGCGPKGIGGPPRVVQPESQGGPAAPRESSRLHEAIQTSDAFLEQFCLEHGVRSVLAVNLSAKSVGSVEKMGLRIFRCDSTSLESISNSFLCSTSLGIQREGDGDIDLLLVDDRAARFAAEQLPSSLTKFAQSRFRHAVVFSDSRACGTGPSQVFASPVGEARIVLQCGTSAVFHRGPRLQWSDIVERFEWWLINLDGRSDRLSHAFTQLGKVGVARARRIQAFDGRRLALSGRRPDWLNKGAVGCYLSHLAVLKQAQARRAPCVIVEDDIEFDDSFIPSVEAFLREVPENWDVLHFPGLDHNRPPSDVGPNCARLTSTWGTAMSVMRLPTIDRLLEDADLLDRPIDDFYIKMMQLLSFFTPSRQVVRQARAKFASDINEQARPSHGRTFLRAVR